jgi:hypothetical protein
MKTALNIAAALAVATVLAQPALAAEGDVKGVNPADILNRADLILKVVNLPQGESITSVAKYDKKLGGGFGANMSMSFDRWAVVAAPIAAGRKRRNSWLFSKRS